MFSAGNGVLLFFLKKKKKKKTERTEDLNSEFIAQLKCFIL